MPWTLFSQCTQVSGANVSVSRLTPYVIWHSFKSPTRLTVSTLVLHEMRLVSGIPLLSLTRPVLSLIWARAYQLSSPRTGVMHTRDARGRFNNQPPRAYQATPTNKELPPPSYCSFHSSVWNSKDQRVSEVCGTTYPIRVRATESVLNQSDDYTLSKRHYRPLSALLLVKYFLFS